MILTSGMYVPALRWRQGEYQALARLPATVRDRLVPYISIPEVEFDFEFGSQKKPFRSMSIRLQPASTRSGGSALRGSDCIRVF